MAFSYTALSQSQLTHNELDDWSPITKNNYTVWLQQYANSSAHKLMLFNHITKDSTTLLSDNTVKQYFKFNGYYMTWVEQDSKDLILFDIRFKTKKVIANTIYWKYQLTDRYIVYNLSNDNVINVYDIPGNSSATIAGYKSSMIEDADGNTIAMIGNDWNAYAYDLDISKGYQLTTNGDANQQHKIRIDGKHVIWYGANDYKDLWLYDMNSLQAKKITNTNDVSTAEIHGNHIAIKHYLGSGGYTISLYNIQRNDSFIVIDSSNLSDPIIADSLLAYSTNSSLFQNTLIIYNINQDKNVLEYSTYINAGMMAENGSVSWVRYQNDECQPFVQTKQGSAEIMYWPPLSGYPDLTVAVDTSAYRWYLDNDQDGYLDQSSYTATPNGPEYLFGPEAALPITNDTLDDQAPITYWHKTVWLRKIAQGPEDDILLYDHKSRTTQQLSTDTTNKTYLRFNGTHLAWIEHESNDFILMDIRTNERVIVDNWTYWNYQLTKDYLVYNRNNETQIRVFNIHDHSSYLINGYSSSKINDWDENTIAFIGTDFNAYIYNLDTDTGRKLTTNNDGNQQYDIRIKGDKVAWHGINTYKDIKLYHLGNSTLTHVTSSGDVERIALSDNYLAYQTRSGGSDYKIWFYDIASPGIYPATPAFGIYGNPVVTDSLLIYNDLNNNKSGMVIYNMRQQSELLHHKEQRNSFPSAHAGIIVWNNWKNECLDLYTPIKGSTEIIAWAATGAYYFDCNDNNADEYPGAIWYADMDDDGYSNGDTIEGCNPPAHYYREHQLLATSIDCNDINANIHPATFWYKDEDQDGYGNNDSTYQGCEPPTGYVLATNDCNDQSTEINPDAIEIAGDNIDQNCDGEDDPVAIEEIVANAEEIILYPNPNKGCFTIKNLPPQCVIQVYNLSGSKVYSKTTSKQQIEIDLSNLKKGIYWVWISSETLFAVKELMIE